MLSAANGKRYKVLSNARSAGNSGNFIPTLPCRGPEVFRRARLSPMYENIYALSSSSSSSSSYNHSLH